MKLILSPDRLVKINRLNSQCFSYWYCDPDKFINGLKDILGQKIIERLPIGIPIELMAITNPTKKIFTMTLWNTKKP